LVYLALAVCLTRRGWAQLRLVGSSFRMALRVAGTMFSESAGESEGRMSKEPADIMSGFLCDRLHPLSGSIGQESSSYSLLKEPPFGTVTRGKTEFLLTNKDSTW